MVPRPVAGAAPAEETLTYRALAASIRGGDSIPLAGKRLMATARDLALQHGAERVWWTVWRQNPKAMDFFEAIGGLPVDEERIMVMIPAADEIH